MLGKILSMTLRFSDLIAERGVSARVSEHQNYVMEPANFR